ncbi:MAG TPA: hypothetical protein PKG88_01030 [Bacteroidales bacterium]|jgi:hypothetical protein|nr:hypothetical protein [Bacteroidales bacterium]
MNSKFLNTTLFLFLLCVSPFLNAQTDTLLDCRYPVLNKKIQFFEFDIYQNIYAVDQNSTLLKLNKNGELISTFSNASYGTLASIQVLSPMKIFLFYKESGILLFLNEQLAPITEPFYLFEKNYQHISLAASSNSNQILLYDLLDSKVILLDFYMKEVSQNQLRIEDFNPIKIIPTSEKGFVFHDPNYGVLFFDSFGTIEKLIPLNIYSEIQIINNQLLFLENDKWVEYDFKKMELRKMDLSKLIRFDKKIKSLKKTDSQLIGIDENGNLFICYKNL